MKLVKLAFVLGFAAAGCGGDDDSLQSLKEQACACKDMACVEKLSEKMEQLEAKFEKQEPSAAEQKLGEEIEQCLAAAMLGGKK